MLSLQDDILGGFILVRCSVCKRKHPRDWSASVLTKWPVTSELTDEQRSLMNEVITHYLNNIWSMCREHRRRNEATTYRLNGEPKLDPSDYPAILDHRMEHNWSAHVTSTRPDRTGDWKCTVEIVRGRVH
jgi:hypothetical protein